MNLVEVFYECVGCGAAGLNIRRLGLGGGM